VTPEKIAPPNIQMPAVHNDGRLAEDFARSIYQLWSQVQDLTDKVKELEERIAIMEP